MNNYISTCFCAKEKNSCSIYNCSYTDNVAEKDIMRLFILTAFNFLSKIFRYLFANEP